VNDQPRSRREEYAESTRQALLESATQLFSANGFVATSLEQVAADARLTKGAVYHHFANKQALFQAVLERLDTETMQAIVERSRTAHTTWDAAVAGLDAFLDRCLDTTYQKICFQEGPGALGFVRWWEHGEAHVAGLLKGVLGALRDDSLVDIDDLDALSTAIYGALTASALSIARAESPSGVRDATRDTMLRLIQGLHP